ncbi:MAG: hypothetical protein WCT04_04695 [Planctomycetota bacterium]
MSGSVGFGDYLKAAFWQHWNLLYLFTSAGIFLLAPGFRDAVFALSMAGEIALLSAMVGNARFRRHVLAQSGAETAAVSEDEMALRFNRLFMGLDPQSKALFEQLKKRCESLQSTPSGGDDDKNPLSAETIVESQVNGANRMLWVYLKLLHTQGALQRFLSTTDVGEIDALELAAKTKLNEIQDSDVSDLAAKKRRSLEDTLKTVDDRHANLDRAKENLEFVELELARIYSKISALSEMTVMRQDPTRISGEVDDAARSVETTEQAIGDLQMFNGLTAEDVQAPRILRPKSVALRV